MIKLRTILDRRGIKHAWLAQKIGVNKATLSLYLSGDITPPDYRIDMICKALGVQRKDVLEKQPR